MATVLDNLREQRETLVSEIEGLMAADDFDPNDQTLVEARGRADTLDARIKSLVEFQQSRNAANAIDAIAVNAKQTQKAAQARVDELMSPGTMWTRSREYEHYMQAPNGNSGRIEIPFDAFARQSRAPILTTTFTGVIPPDRIRPSTAPAQQTPLLDVINRIPVGSNSIEWIYYPAAAPLGTITAEGAGKTEATLTITKKTVTLDTIASWVQYSRQFGEDAPALVSFIDQALSRGIMDKVEAEAASVLTTDATIPVTTNTDGTLMEGIRIAIGNVQAAGYRPQYIVANPADYAALDIEVMGGTLRGPVVNGTYWGVPVVPVGAVASGTAFVGDFNTGMALLARSGVSTYTTDSHASTFISNVLTTLVEVRAKTIVHRPEAITKVAGTVALAAASASSKK